MLLCPALVVSQSSVRFDIIILVQSLTIVYLYFCNSQDIKCQVQGLNIVFSLILILEVFINRQLCSSKHWVFLPSDHEEDWYSHKLTMLRLIVLALSSSAVLPETLVWSDEFDSLDESKWEHLVTTYPLVRPLWKMWLSRHLHYQQRQLNNVKNV